jgi:WD40-like Beta Propeller Repeat
MGERGARRRVVVAAALVAAGTVMLVVGGRSGDASTVTATAAPAPPDIAFSFGDGGIHAMRADGSGRIRLTRGRPRPELATGDADPAWSPDGTTLAFVRTIRLGFEDFRSQVYLLSLDGGPARPVTPGVDGVQVFDPAWSPDGARIAYTLDRLDRRHHFRPSLYLMDADGGNVRLLARDADDAAWSADGRRLAFVSVRDRNGETCYDQCNYHGELYVMDADGSDPVRLTRNRGDDRSPSWSPDGRRIAFASDRNYPNGGGSEIYSIRPDGSCLAWLTNGSPGSGDPVWRNAPRTSSDPGGCGAAHRRPLVRVDLRGVRAVDEHPVYWLGRRYGDLLLSYAEAGRDVGFVYGDCARYHPRACPPPIQLQETSVCSRSTTLSVVAQPHYRPMRVFAAHGLLFVDIGQGDLSVITGPAHVRIFPDARSRRSANRRALAAAADLRRLGKPAAPLAPTALPRTLLVRMRRTERTYGRLGSVQAVARAMGIPSLQVRRRLRLASVVRSLPRVRAVACPRR